MKNFTTLLAAVFLFQVAGLVAQKQSTPNIQRCGSEEHYQHMRATQPKNFKSKEEMNAELAPIIENLKNQRQNEAFGSGAGVITIPVVVHVIHNGTAVNTPGNNSGFNISYEQVLSQINVLNQDYRRMAGTPGANVSGYGLGVDTEIEFCLAQRDPNGNPTNGVTRHQYSQTTWSSSNFDNVVKPQTTWDRNNYLNMWTVGEISVFGNSILGYALPPGGPASSDGVVSAAQYFGSIVDDDGSFHLDTSGSPATRYDRGRTMTHEVGHWLNLAHIWGDDDGACTGTDYVADTPNAAGPNYSCNFPTSCGSVDMVENYMDYTNDQCMNTFTQGQADRMVAAIMTYRASLLNSPGCQSGEDDGGLTLDVFGVDCANNLDVTLKLTNAGTNSMTSATIEYSFGGGNQTYNWTGNLASGAFDNIVLPTQSITQNGTFTANITMVNGTNDTFDSNNTASSDYEFSNAVSANGNNVVFVLTPDNYGSETTWTLVDDSGTTLYSGGPYTDNNNTPITENFALSANECYTFTIFDEYGDGICCSYGQGSYTLSVDGNEFASGAEFEESESVKFYTGNLSVAEVNGEDHLFSVYPNPAKDRLIINFSGDNTPKAYAIYAANGKLVAKKEIANSHDLEVNVASFVKGVYFMEIKGDKTSETVKFIKR